MKVIFYFRVHLFMTGKYERGYEGKILFPSTSFHDRKYERGYEGKILWISNDIQNDAISHSLPQLMFIINIPLHT